MKRGLVVFFFTAALTFAQNRPDSWWKASVGALIAGTAVDAGSSWRGAELNPLLSGSNNRFGWRAVGMKSVLTAGIACGQYVGIRKAGHRKVFTIVNFALTGVYLGVAAHNSGVGSSQVQLMSTDRQQVYGRRLEKR